MAISVHEFKHDGRKGLVILESDEKKFPKAIFELQSSEARDMAMRVARENGLAGANCSSLGLTAYPVTKEGHVIEGLDATGVHRYRVDVEMTAP